MPLRFALASALLLCLTTPLSANVLTDPDAAMQASKSTGRPILVVAGRETCPNCKRVEGQLTRDPQVVPLASQFVLLGLDVDGPKFAQFRRNYQAPGTTLPFLYVVSSTGKATGSHSGIHQNLAGFLREGLSSAGQVLSPQQVRTLTAEREKYEQAEKDGDRRTQVALAVKYGAIPSGAEVVQKFVADLATLTETAQKDLDTLSGKLEAGDTSFELVLDLVRASEINSPLPTVGKGLQAAVRKAKTDLDGGALMVSTAETIVKGETLAAADNARAAAVQYQKVIAGAVEDAKPIAQEKLDALDVDVATLPTDEPETTPEPTADATPTPLPAPATDADAKRAASQLRLAKLLLKRNPDKAKAYLQKVIDTAPDSDAADEARQLMLDL